MYAANANVKWATLAKTNAQSSFNATTRYANSASTKSVNGHLNRAYMTSHVLSNHANNLLK